MKMPIEKSQYIRTTKTGKVVQVNDKRTKKNPANATTLKYAKKITDSFENIVNSDWDSFGNEFTQTAPIKIGKYTITPTLQVNDRNSPADLYFDIEGLDDIPQKLEKYMVGDNSIGIGQGEQDNFNSKTILKNVYKVLSLLGVK